MALFTRNFNVSLVLLFALLSAVQSKFCYKPSVRREWNTLSETEREAWISAVNCIAKLPHDVSLTPIVDRNISRIPPVNTSSTLYDDFVYVHMDLNPKIHFTGLFLPWHRLYINAFELMLKDKCGYNGTQPYWDWSLNTEDFFNSEIFDPSPTSGFGGNGDPNNDWQITDGGFSDDFLRAYPVPHKIRRNFTEKPWGGRAGIFQDLSSPPIDPNKYANTTFSKEEVKKLVEGFKGDFEGFQAYFEWFQGAHAGIHSIINADLLGTCPRSAGAPPNCAPGPKWSPNDPLFFMHHAMVDKIWYDWQNEHPENFWSFHGGSVQAFENFASYEIFPNGQRPYLNYDSKIPSDGMFEEYSIFEVMDTTGGKLCYIYE